MTQTMGNSADRDDGASTDNDNDSSTGKGKRGAKPLTAVDAITKISKILNQLPVADRKRVLAFVSASNEGAE